MPYTTAVEPSTPVWVFVWPLPTPVNLDPVATKGYRGVEVSSSLAFTINMARWKSSTRFVSSIDDIVRDDNYRRIVSMGRSAVPLILEQLATEPEPYHWFAALAEITGADPIPETACGDLIEMAAAWLQWGEDEGLV